MTIKQNNKTIIGDYISSIYETKLIVDIYKGDYDFIIQKAISIYWFVDCKYYGQTNDFTFAYNFTNPNTTHEIQAVVIAWHNPPTTTTVLPTTTVPTNMTTILPNITTASSNGTHVTAVTTTMLPTIMSTNPTTIVSPTTVSTIDGANISLSYVCSNISFIPPDPNKIYGYFYKKIYVRG